MLLLLQLCDLITGSAGIFAHFGRPSTDRKNWVCVVSMTTINNWNIWDTVYGAGKTPTTRFTTWKPRQNSMVQGKKKADCLSFYYHHHHYHQRIYWKQHIMMLYDSALLQQRMMVAVYIFHTTKIPKQTKKKNKSKTRSFSELGYDTNRAL